MRAWFAFSVLAILTACQTAPASPSALRADCAPTISMPQDGVVRVDSCAPTGPMLVRRDQHADVYQGWIDLARDLSPGESKPFYGIEGVVAMNADGSITVTRPGPGPEYPSDVRTIQRNEPEYAEMLARVRGLNPGQSKAFMRLQPHGS